MLRGVTDSEGQIQAEASQETDILKQSSRGSVPAWAQRAALVALTLVVVSGLGYVAVRGAGLIPGPSPTGAVQGVSPTAEPTVFLRISDLPAFPTPTGDRVVTRKLELHTSHPDRPRVKVLKYTVKQGDTLFDIADKYGLKPETILWGNYDLLKGSPDSLRMDQELNILPVDGTYYQWQEGDTIRGVAAYFKVAPEDILDFPGNNIAGYTSVEEVTVERPRRQTGGCDLAGAAYHPRQPGSGQVRWTRRLQWRLRWPDR
jgi:hypothetical protein